MVIQEWWGLSEQIKATVDRFALAGFDALAPDLYQGVVVPYHDAEAAAKQMAVARLHGRDVADRARRGAISEAERKQGRHRRLLHGRRGHGHRGGALRDFMAAVTFYGLPPADAVKPADVKVPLQGHFANRDDFVTPAAVDAFEAGLKAAGKEFEFFRYDADHAFANEQRASVHDRHATELPGTARSTSSSAIISPDRRAVQEAVAKDARSERLGKGRAATPRVAGTKGGVFQETALRRGPNWVMRRICAAPACLGSFSAMP